jgi:hypothetical protein
VSPRKARVLAYSAVISHFSRVGECPSACFTISEPPEVVMTTLATITNISALAPTFQHTKPRGQCLTLYPALAAVAGSVLDFVWQRATASSGAGDKRCKVKH